MKNLAGKVAVVTGAGSGIGRALALELGRCGMRLALCDVNEVGVAASADQCRDVGAVVRSDRLDVTDRGAMLTYAESVASEFGTVNIVVNNAGIAFTGEIEAMSFDEIEHLIDVDFWGVVNGTKAFLPYLIASANGHVVNVSSLFGLLGVPAQGAYVAAKFAVRGFTEVLRQEMRVAGHPVGVTVVHPGGIKTAIARSAGASPHYDAAALGALFDQRLARTSAERAAYVIRRGIQRNKARVLIGADAYLLDAFVRLAGSRYGSIVSAVARRVMPKQRSLV